MRNSRGTYICPQELLQAVKFKGPSSTANWVRCVKFKGKILVHSASGWLQILVTMYMKTLLMMVLLSGSRGNLQRPFTEKWVCLKLSGVLATGLILASGTHLPPLFYLIVNPPTLPSPLPPANDWTAWDYTDELSVSFKLLSFWGTGWDYSPVHTHSFMIHVASICPPLALLSPRFFWPESATTFWRNLDLVQTCSVSLSSKVFGSNYQGSICDLARWPCSLGLVPVSPIRVILPAQDPQMNMDSQFLIRTSESQKTLISFRVEKEFAFQQEFQLPPLSPKTQRKEKKKKSRTMGNFQLNNSVMSYGQLFLLPVLNWIILSFLVYVPHSWRGRLSLEKHQQNHAALLKPDGTSSFHLKALLLFVGQSRGHPVFSRGFMSAARGP